MSVEEVITNIISVVISMAALIFTIAYNRETRNQLRKHLQYKRLAPYYKKIIIFVEDYKRGSIRFSDVDDFIKEAVTMNPDQFITEYLNDLTRLLSQYETQEQTVANGMEKDDKASSDNLQLGEVIKNKIISLGILVEAELRKLED